LSATTVSVFESLDPAARRYRPTTLRSTYDLPGRLRFRLRLCTLGI